MHTPAVKTVRMNTASSRMCSTTIGESFKAWKVMNNDCIIRRWQVAKEI